MEYVLKSDGFLEPEKIAADLRPDRPAVLRRPHPLAGIHRATSVSPRRPTRRATSGSTQSVRRQRRQRRPAGDGDPRASFAVVSDGVVEIHRVPYDFRPTQQKILAAGLHPALADRLARGK